MEQSYVYLEDVISLPQGWKPALMQQLRRGKVKGSMYETTAIMEDYQMQGRWEEWQEHGTFGSVSSFHPLWQTVEAGSG